MPKASSSAIPLPGPLRELPLDLFLRNPNLPQMPNSRATSGVARLLSPTECRLLADEDLISGLRVGALPYRDRLVKFSRCARVPPSARDNRLTRVSSPTERRMHAKEGLITGVRTSRVGAPLYRDPPVNFFRCARVPPSVRNNRLTRLTSVSSSTEHRILAEQGLVSGVRTLRVGAPPVYRDTPPVNFRCALRMRSQYACGHTHPCLVLVARQ